MRGFVAAWDVNTGKKRWKFFLTPNPEGKLDGEASDPIMSMIRKTWSDEGLWKQLGGGANPWDSIAYDPVNKLVFVGTGNSSPHTQFYRSPGGGDNLFVCSIVALHADTGAYAWHYQMVPGEEWDWTCTSSIIQADLTIDGSPIGLEIGNNVSGVTMSGVKVNGAGVGLRYNGTAAGLDVGDTAFASTLATYIANGSTYGVDATHGATFGGFNSGAVPSSGIVANQPGFFAVENKVNDVIDVAGEHRKPRMRTLDDLLAIHLVGVFGVEEVHERVRRHQRADAAVTQAQRHGDDLGLGIGFDGLVDEVGALIKVVDNTRIDKAVPWPHRARPSKVS